MMSRRGVQILFDPEGQPYSGTLDEQVIQWAKDREDESKWRIAVNKLYRGKVVVSTVWTGISANYPGRPTPFETVVFVSGDPAYSYRYFSREEAKTTHKKIVLALRSLTTGDVLNSIRAFLDEGGIDAL